ncbi:MAG TPA: hypothetical protein VFO86_09035 [Terriglobia bacterium]|nr:hypothetical protein [Terriglobia bacterium]
MALIAPSTALFAGLAAVSSSAGPFCILSSKQMPKRDTDTPGFTTDYFHRCVICKRELDPVFVDSHFACECGAILVKIRLQPKQDEIVKKILATGPEVPTKIGVYGPRAAGKSRCLRDASLVVVSECAQDYPGIPAYLMRRNWTQCQESLLEKFKIERPYFHDCGWYNAIEKQYSFPSAMGASRLAFKYADTEDDVVRLERGPECFFLAIDQAEQIRGTDLQRLNSPNRWPGTQPNAVKTVYFLNPGGVGSKYLKEKFVTRQFEDNEDPNDFWGTFLAGWENWEWFKNQGIEINGEPLTWDLFYSLPADFPEPVDGKYTNQWVQSLPKDNRFRIFVTQTPEGKKHFGKPDAIRMGDLFGSFSSFEGQMFPFWDEKKIVVR